MYVNLHLYSIDKCIREQFIHLAQILRKPVQNPTRSVLMKEAHGRFNDALEHSVVKPAKLAQKIRCFANIFLAHL